MNITQILEEIKDDFCRNYCKYAQECEKRLENGEELRPRPLDRI